MTDQPVKVYRREVGGWTWACAWCGESTGGWTTRPIAESEAHKHLASRHVAQLVKVYR